MDTEFNTIRQWLEFQTSMSTDEQSDAELVESIQNLKLTLFDEVLRDRPDLLLLYFQTLEILNELVSYLYGAYLIVNIHIIFFV